MNVPLLWARVAPHQLDAKLYCHLALRLFALLQFDLDAGARYRKRLRRCRSTVVEMSQYGCEDASVRLRNCCIVVAASCNTVAGMMCCVLFLHQACARAHVGTEQLCAKHFLV